MNQVRVIEPLPWERVEKGLGEATEEGYYHRSYVRQQLKMMGMLRERQ